jgi:hypothetical protein
MRCSLGAEKGVITAVRINEDQMRSNEEQLRTRKRKNSSGEDQ